MLLQAPQAMPANFLLETSCVIGTLTNEAKFANAPELQIVWSQDRIMVNDTRTSQKSAEPSSGTRVLRGLLVAFAIEAGLVALGFLAYSVWLHLR